MKRIIALLLGVLMIVSLMGCAAKKTSVSSDRTTEPTKDETTVVTTTEKEEAEAIKDDFSNYDNVAYVLIYNPDIYKEESDYNLKMSTGEFGQWINVDLFRGEQKPEEPEFQLYSQRDLEKQLDGLNYDLSVHRGPANVKEYDVGDTESYYYDDGMLQKGLFTCSVAGENCYLWQLEGQKIDASEMKKIVDEFDNVIYPADVETFGTPRYADEGGKINILFHPMEGNMLGYFRPIDLFTSEEITDEEAEEYGANRDHAIIHINSMMLGGMIDEQIILSTLAHELQHLINFTDCVEYNKNAFAPTWINEAMSGYIEEKLYPGVKNTEGHYLAFAYSDLIRHGQSLYNFDTSREDIGVYGSVFLFSQYLENLAGDEVFHDFHKYWRTTFSGPLSDANALFSCFSSEKSQEIDAKYQYPSEVTFSGSNEEWMSKLTLDFYLSLLKYDSSDPQAYQNVVAQTLLYDEINPADIEGGGRVIAATKDGKFEVADNADTPLIYIGFDEDFNQITDLIIH